MRENVIITIIVILVILYTFYFEYLRYTCLPFILKTDS